MKSSALESEAGRRYLDSLSALIRRLGEVGTMQLTALELETATRHIAAAQARYLVRNDTEDQFYGRAFSNLGVDVNADELDPKIFLDHMVYRAADLVGGRAQKLRLADGLAADGRVFYSSGTTNPGKRKCIYYDSATQSLLRQLSRFLVEGTIGFSLTNRTQVLLMMPPEATLGMPFAFFQSTMYEAFEVGVHWGTQFLSPPTPWVEPVFGIETAELVFQDNIAPNPKTLEAYDAACAASPGPHIIEGILPTLYGLLCAPGDTVQLRPQVVACGGGLKRAGIPPHLLGAGGAALQKYLDRIKDVTGTDPREFGAMRTDRPIEEDTVLDTLLTVFLSYEVERVTGARCLNNYAGAEILPVFYAAGTFRELYGENYFRVGGGDVPSNIFVPPPGAACQLRHPITDDVIPVSDTQTPGILRLWNPFNVSHLHAIETEDLLSWTPLPVEAQFRPAYANGVGVRYRGRASSDTSGGYCAA